MFLEGPFRILCGSVVGWMEKAERLGLSSASDHTCTWWWQQEERTELRLDGGVRETLSHQRSCISNKWPSECASHQEIVLGRSLQGDSFLSCSIITFFSQEIHSWMGEWRYNFHVSNVVDHNRETIRNPEHQFLILTRYDLGFGAFF